MLFIHEPPRFGLRPSEQLPLLGVDRTVSLLTCWYLCLRRKDARACISPLAGFFFKPIGRCDTIGEAKRQLAEAFKRGRAGRLQFEANILSAYGGSRLGGDRCF